MSSESLLFPNDEESKNKSEGYWSGIFASRHSSKKSNFNYYEAEELLEEIIVTERQIF